LYNIKDTKKKLKEKHHKRFPPKKINKKIMKRKEIARPRMVRKNHK
jgi:hypothetical protein